jgi:DNA-binding beta-propeller fold protein YncE
VRADGGIYVSDSANHKIRLILNGVVSTVAGVGQGFCDGAGSVAKLDTPMSIALHPSGVLVVADAWNHRIRAVDAGGNVTTWAGDGKVNVKDGPGAQAEFNFPFALAVRPDGSTIIVDAETGLLRLVGNDAAHTVSTFAGELGRSGWRDGDAAHGSVMEILAVASRASGEIVLVDGATWRLRAIGSGGVIDTHAGGATSSLVDGLGANAGFQLPHGAAAAPDGTLLVVDTGNHALRRIVAP